ncbi:deoxynucleotide monophosphate kinase family protein [Priestia megaterium]
MKIAFVGKMRSGKDTAGNYLLSKSQWTKQLAFGDEIKGLIKTYFPHLLVQKPRKLMQEVGQLFRKYDADIWVKRLNTTYLNYKYRGYTDFIITDVRQQNEVDYLKSQGFVIVKVETAEELRIERIKASGDAFNIEDLYHETEQAVDTLEYDYLVTNNTSIKDLTKQIDFILQEEF